MAKLRIELAKFNVEEQKIDEVLLNGIAEAVRLNIEMVECNPGKVSDDLRKRAVHFLEKPEIRKLYYKLEKGGKNSGRLVIHFRHRRIR